MSAISCIPSKEASSRRPTNGEMKVAPAFAASKAWAGEKQSVTLTIVPSPVSARQAFSPSGVSGTLIATLSPTLRSTSASRSMPSQSSATTSAETGPATTAAISRSTSRKSRPDLWTRLGLVVTPSSSPVAASSRISAISAVSAKNFMSAPWLCRSKGQ